jgi:hypothetical protein
MTTEVEQESQDGWSEDGQIYYFSGKAFGLNINCDTIYLGEAEVIKRALETKQLPKDLDPLQEEALKYVLDYREVKEYGNQPKTERASNFRGRPVRDFKHRVQTSQRATASKRIALHQIKRKK